MWYTRIHKASQCSLTVQTCQGLLYNWFVNCLERRNTHKLGTQDTHTQYYYKLLILADHSNGTHAHNVPHSSHVVLTTLVTRTTPNSPLMRGSSAVLVRPTLSVGAETTQVVPLHWGCHLYIAVYRRKYVFMYITHTMNVTVLWWRWSRSDSIHSTLCYPDPFTLDLIGMYFQLQQGKNN